MVTPLGDGEIIQDISEKPMTTKVILKNNCDLKKSCVMGPTNLHKRAGKQK